MLSRQGWAVLAMSLIGVVLGRLFGVLELYILGAGLLILVLACWVWVRARPISLRVARTPRPEQLQVGDVGAVEINVTNTARTKASALSLWEPVSGLGGASLRLAPLRSAESAVAAYRLPAVKRGTIQFGPLIAERRDPFGLARTRKTVAGIDEVIVLPSFHRLKLPDASRAAGPLGQLLRVRSMVNAGTEFRALREYVEGDDLRTVSWKASARTANLMVRESEPDSLRRCTVILDLDPAQYDDESFERAISAAASAVVTIEHAGLDLRFVAGSDGDFRNAAQATVLRFLADCQPEAGPRSAASTKSPTGEGLGLILIVTGAANAPIVDAMARSATHADVVITFACTSAPSSSGRGLVVDATSPDLFESSWANLVGVAPLQIEVPR